MKSIVTCRQMKALDGNTIVNKGIPSLVLMERAALKTVDEMEVHFRKTAGKQKILCVCGSGNNGGDGIAIARILFLHGYDAEIQMAGNPEHMTEETVRQLKIAENYNVPVVNNPDPEEYTTIVDAIFGIGLTRPVEGRYRELISSMNKAKAWKVAVDIPSGVDGAKELVQAAKKGISADFNGVISKVSVVEGSTTALGTELFTLQNTDNVDVNVNISKYDYDKVKEGQKAEITLAGKTYEGEVKSVSHIATQNEKGASLISADVKIMNPDEEIFIGVDAKVTIQAEQARDVLVIPAEVVNIGKEGSFCYVLENGVIIRKDITTGISSDDYVEVMDGLAEGDEVIRDLGDLEEGMTAEASTGQDDVEASAGASESTDSESVEEGA